MSLKEETEKLTAAWDEEELALAELEAERHEQERIELGYKLAQHYLHGSDAILSAATLEPDWLVPYAIPKGSVSFFVGRAGSSKSWAAYDLALAAIQQRDWLGLGVPRAGVAPSALVLNYDSPHAEFCRRMLRMGLQKGEPMHVHSFGAHSPPDPYPPVLQLPEAFDPLYAIVYAFRPSIIVVDSLRQASTADENNSQEMARVLMQLKRFAALGASVIVIHHASRSGTQMRGSTEIEASADGIAFFESISQTESFVTWSKTRGWVMQEPSRVMRLVDEGVTAELPKGDRTYVRPGPSLSSVLADGGLSRVDITTALGLAPDQVKKMIENGLATGLIAEKIQPTGGKLIELTTLQSSA